MIKANFIVMSMELADIDFDLIDLRHVKLL